MLILYFSYKLVLGKTKQKTNISSIEKAYAHCDFYLWNFTNSFYTILQFCLCLWHQISLVDNAFLIWSRWDLKLKQLYQMLKSHYYYQPWDSFCIVRYYAGRTFQHFVQWPEKDDEKFQQLCRSLLGFNDTFFFFFL